jgi:hypothetical protein
MKHLLVIGWNAANDIRSAGDGMKAWSHSRDGSFSAHVREFAIQVCKNSSLEAYWHEINEQPTPIYTPHGGNMIQQ